MTTAIFGLDEIIESQSAKYATHNAALRQLEGRSVRVLSRTTTAEPGSPAEGDAYIIPTGATGTDWATYTAGDIALYSGAAWGNWTPVEGVRVWVNDENVRVAYNSADWIHDTIAPMLSKSVAGAADVTLTALEAAYPAIDMTGAITANINMIVPADQKTYLVENSSTGSFTITVKTSAGSGVVVPQGGRTLLYCDGVDVVPVAAGDVNFQDWLFQRPEIRDYSETVATPTSSSGTLTVDIETANVFNVPLTENVTTLTISNPSAAGLACSITLILTQDATGGRTFAWPASVISAGGSNPVVTSAANAIDVYTLLTTDAGTTWLVFTGGQAFA